MKQEAINDFIIQTDLSYNYGLIDHFVYYERIVTLYELCNVENDVIKSLLPEFVLEHLKNLLEDKDELTDLSENNFGSIIAQELSGNNFILLYQTNIKGKLCKWEFYKKDADPHPSVPHGHGINMSNLRLDPYRRTIFEKQSGRLIYKGLESKKYINALWNDDIFREYALIAINNFINSGIVGENYNWLDIRGVYNPLRLPQKR